MQVVANLDLPYAELEDFCTRWHIRKLAFFGSVLRDDFREDSDVDVLVHIEEDIVYPFSKYYQMEQELADLLDRPIDLMDWVAVEESPNYLRRQEILSTAQVVYAK